MYLVKEPHRQIINTASKATRNKVNIIYINNVLFSNAIVESRETHFTN